MAKIVDEQRDYRVTIELNRDDCILLTAVLGNSTGVISSGIYDIVSEVDPEVRINIDELNEYDSDKILKKAKEQIGNG